MLIMILGVIVALAPPPSEDDMLRGPPAVPPTAAAPVPTITERTFDGRVILIDGEPEAAALRAMNLTHAQRDALDSIVSRRITAFDALVRDRVSELERGFAALSRLESAANGRERFAAVSEFARSWESFREWREHGSVIDEMASELSSIERAKARRLVREFHRALTVERAGDLHLPTAHLQVQAHLRLEAFGRMVQASFERQGRSGELDLERVAKALRLTPEQTERARVIFSELALKEYRMEAGHWDRFRAISTLMGELSSEQRVLAWRFLRSEGRK